MKKGLILSIVALISVAFLAFIAPQEQKKGEPWKIPAEYKNKANPHKGDASLDKLARAAYGKHCRSCHGTKGKGDGPMAKNLKTHPGDFGSAEFQKHTDGEIYYMSIIGRDEMPNFEKEITDPEERWALVNFIRTLKE